MLKAVIKMNQALQYSAARWLQKFPQLGSIRFSHQMMELQAFSRPNSTYRWQLRIVGGSPCQLKNLVAKFCWNMLKTHQSVIVGFESRGVIIILNNPEPMSPIPRIDETVSVRRCPRSPSKEKNLEKLWKTRSVQVLKPAEAYPHTGHSLTSTAFPAFQRGDLLL